MIFRNTSFRVVHDISIIGAPPEQVKFFQGGQGGGSDPEVLLLRVVVLVGPQGVGDPLNRVHDRAGEVVDGVDLELVALKVQGEE